MNLDDDVLWPGNGRMSLDTAFWLLRRVFGAHCQIAIKLTAGPSALPSIVEAWPIL
jgi:hypothetical protein